MELWIIRLLTDIPCLIYNITGAFLGHLEPFCADKPRLQPPIIPDSLSYDRDLRKQRLFFEISFPSISVLMLWAGGAGTSVLRHVTESINMWCRCSRRAEHSALRILSREVIGIYGNGNVIRRNEAGILNVVLSGQMSRGRLLLALLCCCM